MIGVLMLCLSTNLLIFFEENLFLNREDKGSENSVETLVSTSQKILLRVLSSEMSKSANYLSHITLKDNYIKNN